MIASGSEDGTIQIWDTVTDGLKQTLNLPSTIEGEIRALFFLQDNETLASASDGGKQHGCSIGFWNISTGVFKKTWGGSSNPLYQAEFSPDGNWAVLVFQVDETKAGNTVWLLDMHTGHHEPIFEDSENFTATPAFSSDSKTIVAASTQRSPFLVQIRQWSIEERQVNRTFRGQGFITAMAFSPDQKLLASGTSSLNVEVWDVLNGTLKHVFTGNGGWVMAVAFSPDSNVVAAGSQDGHVRLWDTATDTSSLQPHENPVSSVAFSPTGQLLVSTSSDRTARLWNVSTGRCERLLEGHTDRITTAVFSPNGELIASASCDKTIRLWDTKSGKCRRHLRGHTDDVTAVCFSPDGMKIASASKDRTVSLWCTNKDWRSTLPTLLAPSKESVKLFKGHSLPINAVSFSPDGRFVVSASDDRTARVWNIETRSHISLTGGRAQFVAVAFSTNGSKVAAASADRNIWCWDANNGSDSGSMKAPGQYRNGHGMTGLKEPIISRFRVAFVTGSVPQAPTTFGYSLFMRTGRSGSSKMGNKY